MLLDYTCLCFCVFAFLSSCLSLLFWSCFSFCVCVVLLFLLSLVVNFVIQLLIQFLVRGFAEKRFRDFPFSVKTFFERKRFHLKTFSVRKRFRVWEKKKKRKRKTNKHRELFIHTIIHLVQQRHAVARVSCGDFPQQNADAC